MRAISTAVLLTAGCAAAPDAHAPLLAAAPTSPVRVGAGPGQLALADVNGDRRLDLVARRLLDKRIEVLLGDGRGGFAAAGGVAFDDPPGAMEFGDLNGDGRPDLVVARRSDAEEKIDVLLGAADGSFARAPGSPLVVATAMQTYKPLVLIADLDEDGHADVVFLNGRRHVVVVLLGDGRGGLVHRSATAEGRSAEVDLGPSESVSTFDLGDLDGDLDVVLARHDATLLDVLLNSGRGAFTAAPGSPLDLGKQPYGVVPADMDGDGRVDLVVTAVSGTKPFESDVVVLLGPGFTPAPGSPFKVGRGAYFVAVGDVDEDGHADVASSSFEGDGVVLLLGRAAGGR